MKNDKEIKISKIEIQIGPKKLELTLEEARELKDILNKAFPDRYDFQVKYPIHINPPERTYTPYWHKWDVICSDETMRVMNKVENS